MGLWLPWDSNPHLHASKACSSTNWDREPNDRREIRTHTKQVLNLLPLPIGLDSLLSGRDRKSPTSASQFQAEDASVTPYPVKFFFTSKGSGAGNRTPILRLTAACNAFIRLLIKWLRRLDSNQYLQASETCVLPLDHSVW